MENSTTDSYLHKKFKKQLSIEPRSYQPPKNENKSAVVESREEKTLSYQLENSTIRNQQQFRDNKQSVPKQSTNQNSSSSSSLNLKSSISEKCLLGTAVTTTTVTAANLQSSNSCISYAVVANNNLRNSEPPHQHQTGRFSFDNKLQLHLQRHEPVVSTATTTTVISTTSSILENLYSSSTNNNSSRSSSYVKTQDDPSSNRNEDASAGERKDEHQQPQPSDKTSSSASSSGKYVCPYCNLACSKPSVLQKHIRAHTNERPYPCDSCGFSFKTRSNLYKHCRSRTHANRVMGNKVQEISAPEANNSIQHEPSAAISATSLESKNNERNSRDDLVQDLAVKNKPYKPRFHTKSFNSSPSITKENIQDERMPEEANKHSNLLSEHINDIISKNNSIVNNSSETYFLKKKTDLLDNNNEYSRHHQQCDFNPSSYVPSGVGSQVEEPLNLTSKNRKRCLSEVMEPVAQKSLIKELLLKNLNSDMQCPHCKMIFQTVTELELHKLRSCKGFIKPGAKYTRSSSVNVASILTQNKNAFDNIPQMQNAVFPLKSPGPFLGKTRLVESDKSKSFSFDDGLPGVFPMSHQSSNIMSPLILLSEKEKKSNVKMFGGEVKITQTTGETKSYKIENKDEKYSNEQGYVEFSGKLSENRVVKSGLQSGGTVLTNKANYQKSEGASPDVIRVYENSAVSPSIDLGKAKFNYEFMNDERGLPEIRSQADLISSNTVASPSYKYTNIMDFSQKAVKLLTPNLKQPSLAVPGVPAPIKFTFQSFPTESKNSDLTAPMELIEQNAQNLKISDNSSAYSPPKIYANKAPAPSSPLKPMNLFVDGKVVRYVPGMPGPVAAADPLDVAYNPLPLRNLPRKPSPLTIKDNTKLLSPSKQLLEVRTDFSPKSAELKSPKPPPPSEKSPAKLALSLSEPKKFARPNSLALKPTTASLKQHHGLTPTMFNQILISPDTPRVAKKYMEHYLHGNYFSYLGLKCSTKPVYCTLNKTQPFYVPHFQKLSMYSEWRQQDTKTDKLYVSAYDSRQKHQKYTTAGRSTADLIVHSSYKFEESGNNDERSDEQPKPTTILGGYECNEDYTYIRGRGRGRYVCDQCGIRCKKPSMLKKHIRTHSNDRPYTCNHCNFSFKTKGNLTKHMKSKAHTKNYAASGSGSSTQQSGTQSSDSDTEDSGMDSSDESTRREEHEAAYGLLSLSQKTSQPVARESSSPASSANLSGSETPSNVMNTEEIEHVSNTNYVKNKILDEKSSLAISPPKDFGELPPGEASRDGFDRFLGKSSLARPLTYPYMSVLSETGAAEAAEKPEPKCIKQFHVIQKYALASPVKNKPAEVSEEAVVFKSASKDRTSGKVKEGGPPEEMVFELAAYHRPPVLKVNDAVVLCDSQNVGSDLRKRSFDHNAGENNENLKRHKNENEVMDLSMPTDKAGLHQHPEPRFNSNRRSPSPGKKQINNGSNLLVFAPIPNEMNVNYVKSSEQRSPPNNNFKQVEYDNSAMETLADIATKQVKLEKNTMAKSVASEIFKIATKNEYQSGEGGVRDSNLFSGSNKEVNELIVKPEGSKNCHICTKSFSRMSQLRLHMNIHYLERPFRCHSCSVSFRTKGHLQKHERSASHHNKLSSSPALSSSEPRPFKCIDCNIAFRIHGHLAKHLRSKMHIMKLECLAKIPFGLYAELERSNSLLTEINTADGDQCLESLKTLAKKVFINDPSKLNQLNTSMEILDTDS